MAHVSALPLLLAPCPTPTYAQLLMHASPSGVEWLAASGTPAARLFTAEKPPSPGAGAARKMGSAEMRVR